MQVIVGIIIDAEQKVLIAQRPSDKYKGGLWEFPGGKIEKNESCLMALQRELAEEIGVTVLDAQPWLNIQHDYGDRIVHLHVWRVMQFSGIPYGKEGQPIQWIAQDQLNLFEFPAGNQEILVALKALSTLLMG